MVPGDLIFRSFWGLGMRRRKTSYGRLWAVGHGASFFVFRENVLFRKMCKKSSGLLTLPNGTKDLGTSEFEKMHVLNPMGLPTPKRG